MSEPVMLLSMEQRTFKNVNKYLNTNIYSYLDTFGGQSSNLYLNVVHFFNTRLAREKHWLNAKIRKLRV